MRSARWSRSTVGLGLVALHRAKICRRSASIAAPRWGAAHASRRRVAPEIGVASGGWREVCEGTLAGLREEAHFYTPLHRRRIGIECRFSRAFSGSNFKRRRNAFDARPPSCENTSAMARFRKKTPGSIGLGYPEFIGPFSFPASKSSGRCSLDSLRDRRMGSASRL